MDEQKIIIDEIDVSKCKYYSIKEYISNNNGYTEYPDYCSCYADGHCFKHNNCYYKNWQRAEQKLAKIKKVCNKFIPDHYKILLIINHFLIGRLLASNRVSFSF